MNLSLLLEMAAHSLGEEVAIGPIQGGASFAELQRLAAGGAAVLRDQKAQHAVLLAQNGPTLPHLLFSSAMAGVPFCPLNYRLAGDRLVESMARLDEPLVVCDDEFISIVPSTIQTVSTTEFRDRSLKGGPSGPFTSDADAPAVLLFTSGTSAKPKIVPLRHEHLLTYVLSTVEFGSAAGDVALISVPPYHVAAVGAALTNLYAGRRMVFLPAFSPREWLHLVRSEGVSSAMVVPTMLSRIIDYLQGAPAEVPTLRHVSYGGARMPAPVLEAALAAFPTTGFTNAYGLTETSSTVTLLGPEDHRLAIAASDPKMRARLASVGLPVPGIELQIRTVSGDVAGPSEVGDLWVRGAQVSGEYVGIGSVLDNNGWFPTRDRAWVDEDGYLFIEGRTDDTIIRGGENIAPAEVEDALLTHPGVEDVAVVGVEDDEWGQRLVAVVVRRAGTEFDDDAIRLHARRTLRGSRTPDDVVFRDELPRTSTGKIIRRDLVAQLQPGNRGPM